MKIAADVGELTKALGTAQKKLNKASHELGRIGSNLSSSISLPLAAIGGIAAIS